MKLAGSVALVTGASRGIGRGCAEELARAGADVVVNYRRHAEEAEETAAAIRAMGRRALVCAADVADREAVFAMVQQAVEHFGRLDIAVANAAFSIRRPFLELEPEEVAAVWGVSLWGVFHTCQAAARQMVRQGEGGSIVVMSSVRATIPFVNSLPYQTAKAGINQMAYTMANELAPYRIRVNVVEPGWIDTPGEHAFATDEE
ncbi:MAG: SDR family oxidoreductase, partial [Armatimonadota bacterium]|nr:SDR family oxidoreductase [Armatimonadota bacterium]